MRIIRETHPDEIKQYANHVIGSNEEDSVVKFILHESNLPLE